jgi:hypothetical protein
MATSNIRINIDTKSGQQSTRELGNSIGQVGDRTQSLKAELRQMKEALLELDEGSKEFQELAFNAAELEDAIGDVSARVRVLASDTLRLDQGIQITQGLAGAFGAAQGAVAMLGIENETLLKTMVKLQATQNIINGLTQVANMLNKDSAAGILLRDIRTKALNGTLFTQTGATTGATAATRLLGVAMNALPILAIIAGITAIVVAMNNMSRETEEAEKSLKKLNETNLNKIKIDLLELKESNNDLEKAIREVNLSVLEGNLTEAEANEKRKALYEERLTQIDEEKKQSQLALGGRIFGLEQQLGLEVDVNETFDEKVKKIRNIIAAQDAENGSLKQITASLELYINTVDTEITLKEKIADLNKRTTEEENTELQKRRENYKKHLELMFLIQNQISVNEIEEERRKLRDLNEDEGASLFERLDQLRKVSGLEQDVINQKYDFQVKQAKGNAKEIELLELQRLAELAKAEDTYTQESKKLSKERTTAAQKDIDDLLDATKEPKKWQLPPFDLNLPKQSLEELLSDISAITSQAFSGISDLMNVLGETMRLEQEALAYERELQYSQEAMALENLLAQNLISREEYDAKLGDMNQKKAMEERQAKRKAFNDEKNMRIASASMSMAQAILNGLSTQPILPLGLIMAAMAAVVGGIQIANIKNEQFKAARGGMVPGSGPSHIDSVPSMLAPGEMVINSQSASMFPQTLSQINKAGGGVSLAPEIPQKTTTGGGEKVYQENRDAQRVYVLETDITQKQKRVTRIEDITSF